ncbi:imidazoleglycerol-phosphate dehydratase [Phlyctema vagabunda]|uniref:Imidazoleglycerol-phosphate dehydratase n=1 Tax=Phlyctema vagabunda TaxID=108571 RepID=A0ABR4PUJ3_9HELO
MKTHGGLKDDEASDAAWEAARGAASGGAKWGFYSAALGGVGYAISPIYRGLTIQFKVFLQMSGMVMGAMLEADHRLREYEAKVRMHKRMVRDRAVWESYEKEFEQAPKSDKKQ